MDQAERKAIARQGSALAHRLWLWDPLNISPPEDEYDCVAWPLLRRLRDGEPAAEISRWLDSELEHHFGLEGGGPNTAAFVTESVIWMNGSTD